MRVRSLVSALALGLVTQLAGPVPAQANEPAKLRPTADALASSPLPAAVTQALQAVNSAGVNRARAEADYQIALARLAQAAGCLLGHAGVEWSDRLDEPRLAAPDVDPAAALPDSFMGPRSELRDSPAPAAPPGNAGGTDAPSPTDPSAVGPPVEPVQP